MAWFDEFNLPGATIDGHFGFIKADGQDEDDYPDVVLADGTVTFTATTEAARIDGAWLGIQPVTAQIFEGKIVISEEDPRPVRLLATDAPIGVADWAWRASFKVDGFQLNELTFRAPRDTTVNLTADLIPIKSQPYQIIEGASIVDSESDTDTGLIRFKMSDGTYTRWVPGVGKKGEPGERGQRGETGATGRAATLAMGSVTVASTADAWMTGTPEDRALHIALPRGVKGDTGEKGDKGDTGETGPYGGTEVTSPQVAEMVATPGEARDALDVRYGAQVSVRSYGAKGDGTTDDTAAIQAAIDAASAAGVAVFLPGGRYRISSALALPSRTIMRGSGRSTVIDIKGLGSTVSTPKTAMEATGTIGAALPLAAPAEKGVKTVSLSSESHGLAVGDYVILSSDDFFAATTALKRGETKRVESVAGAIVGFEDSTYDEYATSPRLQKVVPVEGIQLSELTIEGTPNDNMERGLFVTYGIDIQVHNCTFNYTDWNSVNLRSVVNFKVTGNTFRSVKWISNGPNYYGLVVENASSHGVFSGNHGTLCRHLFTTGYTTSMPGASRFVVVEGNVDSYSQSASYDTHDGSEHITFRGNTSSYSSAGGINVEGRETIIEGNHIVGFTTSGIILRAGVGNTLVRGNRISTAVSGVAGVSVRRSTVNSQRPTNISISGNTISGPLSNAIEVLNSDGISIADNSFPGAWRSYVIRVTDSLGVRVLGNSCGASEAGFLYISDTQNSIISNNDCGVTAFGVRGAGAHVQTLISGNDFSRVTDSRKVLNLTGSRRIVGNLGIADESVG